MEERAFLQYAAISTRLPWSTPEFCVSVCESACYDFVGWAVCDLEECTAKCEEGAGALSFVLVRRHDLSGVYV